MLNTPRKLRFLRCITRSCQWECCRVTESGSAGTTARSSRVERLPDYSSRQSGIRGDVLAWPWDDDLAHRVQRARCSSASHEESMGPPPLRSTGDPKQPNNPDYVEQQRQDRFGS